MKETLIKNIAVVPIEGTSHLKMVWPRMVEPVDVTVAFRDIVLCLNEASAPVHIMVDIRQDPNFPMQATIFEALNGPFKHPKMGQWLVLGNSSKARAIANVLSKIGRRNSIHWFEDEDRALRFLAELSES